MSVASFKRACIRSTMTSFNRITGGEYMHELRSASACAFELVVGHGEASENAPKRGLRQAACQQSSHPESGECVNRGKRVEIVPRRESWFICAPNKAKYAEFGVQIVRFQTSIRAWVQFPPSYRDLHAPYRNFCTCGMPARGELAAESLDASVRNGCGP